MTSPRDDSPLPTSVRDIFSDSAFGRSEEDGSAGVHRRRQSSVLFTLDDLGREGARGATVGATDSSGLIDIRAAAAAVAAAPGRPSLPDTDAARRPGETRLPLAVPVVRQRGLGPWILAAAVVLVGGGIAFALIATSHDAPLAPPRAEPIAPAPIAPSAPIAATGTKATAAPTPAAVPTTPVVAVAESTVAPPIATAPTSAPQPPGPGGSRARSEPRQKPPGTPSAPPPTTTTPAAPEGETPAPLPPTPSEENTKRVNRLIESLGPKGPPTAPIADETGGRALPEQLSAASVRAVLKGRFGACTAKLASDSGPVSVMTRFALAGSGVVESARVTDPAGVGQDVQSCVVSALKGAAFPKFSGPSMTWNLPVKLR